MGIVSKSHAFELVIVLLDAAGIQILSVPVGVHLAVLVSSERSSLDFAVLFVDPTTAAAVAIAVGLDIAVAALGRFFGSDHAQKGQFAVGLLETILQGFLWLQRFPKGTPKLLPALFGANGGRSRRLGNPVDEPSQGSVFLPHEAGGGGHLERISLLGYSTSYLLQQVIEQVVQVRYESEWKAGSFSWFGR